MLILSVLIIVLIAIVFRSLFRKQEIGGSKGYVLKQMTGIEEIYIKGGRLYAGGGKVLFLAHMEEESEEHKSLFQTSNVRAAFRKLLNAQPLLRARHISRADKWFYQLNNDNCDQDDVPFQIIESDEESWESIAQREVNNDFPMNDNGEREPVSAKFLIQKSSSKSRSVHILFCINHAVVDGVSIGHVCHEFLQHLMDQREEIVEKAFTKNMVEMVHDSYFSPLSRMVATSVAMVEHIVHTKKNLRLLHKPLEKKSVDSYSQLPITSDKTIVYFKEIPDIRKFIQICKQNQVSVNSGLVAVLSLASAKLIAHNDSKQQLNSFPINISAGVPVNIRQVFSPPVPNNQVGYFVQSIHLESQIEESAVKMTSGYDTIVWDMARSNHKQTREQLAAKERIFRQICLRESASSLVWKDVRNSTLTLGTINVTNVGDQSKTIQEKYTNAESTLTIKGIRFFSGIQLWKAATIAIATWNNKCFITFALPSPPMENIKDHQELVKASMEILNSLIDWKVTEEH